MADFDAMMKGHSMLMDGLGKLREGLQRRATNQAINQAQEEMNTVNQFETDEMSRRKQMNLVAQNMTMNMLKSGADANQIQLASQAITPKQIQNSAQAFYEGQMTGSKGLQDLAKTGQTFEQAPENERQAKELKNRMEIAKINAGSRGDRANRADNKIILEQMGKFRTQPDVVELKKSLNAVAKFDTLLNDNSATGFNLSKLALVKIAQSAGVVTETDAKAAEGSPDIASKVLREVSLKTTGKPLTEDANTFRRLAISLGNSNRDQLARKVKAFARSTHKYTGLTYEEFHDDLLNGINDGEDETPASTKEGTAPAGGTTAPKKYTGQYR